MSLKVLLFFQGILISCQCLHLVKDFSTQRSASEHRSSDTGNRASEKTQETPICCLPFECEGFTYVDNAGSLFGLIFIANYSGPGVYSYTDKKTYQNLTGISVLAGDEPAVTRMEDYIDYTKGIDYRVDDGECRLWDMDEMTAPCIPADARLISRGMFGDEGVPIETYSFVGPDGNNLTTTVVIDETESPPLCRPIQHTLLQIGDESVQNLVTFNIVDIGPIHSKDDFKIPGACRNTTRGDSTPE